MRQVAAVLFLPFTVLVVVPLALVLFATPEPGALKALLTVAGIALPGIGVMMVAWTARVFARLEKGTLVPWDPTRELVTVGPCRHSRNPMHTCVFLALFGEALVLRSASVLFSSLLFTIGNLLHITLVEEQGPVTGFGASYGTYRRNVPRWLPRLRPWTPESEDSF